MTKTQIFLQNFCHGQICCPKTLESRKKPAENKQTAKAVCYLSRYSYSTVYPVIDNPPDHPRNPPLEVKLNAIHRCYELGENIKYVSEDIGYSRASIYQWRKRYLKEGTLGLMNHKNITPGTLVEGSVSSTDISSDEINQLKAQMQDMQLESKRTIVRTIN